MGRKQLLLNVFENELSIDKVEIEITENKKNEINEYFEFMEEYPTLFNLGVRPSDDLNIEWSSNGEHIVYLGKSNLHFNNKEINIESLDKVLLSETFSFEDFELKNKILKSINTTSNFYDEAIFLTQKYNFNIDLEISIELNELESVIEDILNELDLKELREYSDRFDSFNIDRGIDR